MYKIRILSLIAQTEDILLQERSYAMSFDRSLRLLERQWQEEGKENESLANRLLRTYLNANLIDQSKKILPFLLKRKLEKLKGWFEVEEIINIDPKRIFIVGGKIYRSLLEIIYDKDYGSDEVDWDIYFLGNAIDDNFQSKLPNLLEKNRNFIRKDDHIIEGIFKTETDESYEKNSLRLHEKKCNYSMDIISVIDVAKIQTNRQLDCRFLDESLFRKALQWYFKGVPLTIQAVAFDPTQNKLYGSRGSQSIYSRLVKVNNNDCEKYYAAARNESIEEYFKKKNLNDLKFER